MHAVPLHTIRAERSGWYALPGASLSTAQKRGRMLSKDPSPARLPTDKLLAVYAPQGKLIDRARILDLRDNSWIDFAFSIWPPNPTLDSPCLYVVPATAQVLDIEGQPVQHQEQYQQWRVLGLDFWDKEGKRVSHLYCADC